MTKLCKSCKEPIEASASKCPKCQAFQSWYRSPQIFSFLFLIPLLGFSYYTTSQVFHSTGYSDYADQIRVTIVGSQESQMKSAEIFLNVEIENSSKKTWKRPKFQVQSLDGQGKVIVVENLSDYDLIIPPNGKVVSTLTLRTIPEKTVASRHVTLTEADADRY